MWNKLSAVTAAAGLSQDPDWAPEQLLWLGDVRTEFYLQRFQERGRTGSTLSEVLDWRDSCRVVQEQVPLVTWEA